MASYRLRITVDGIVAKERLELPAANRLFGRDS
jgi:hypothetical protein